jgi:hypothetical protein
MSPDSKIWIYFSEQAFSDSDLANIDAACQAFCQSWTAHEQSLKADYQLRYKHFIVLMVDETQNKASGCSIDKSVAFIRNLGNELQVNFFNRMVIPFLIDNQVISHSFHNITSLCENGIIQPDSQIFNLQVSNLNEFEQSFIVPFEQHWLSKKIQTTIN